MTAFNESAAKEDTTPNSDEKAESHSPNTSGDGVMCLLLAADATPLGPLVRYWVGTGTTPDALESLQWGDLRVFSNGAMMLSPWCAPRNASRPTRFPHLVPLGSLATEALRQQRTLQAEDRRRYGRRFDNTGHVFHAPWGGSIGQCHMPTAWMLELSEKVGIGYDDLRDGLDTWMYGKGFDDAERTRILGVRIPKTVWQVIEERQPRPRLMSQRTVRYATSFLAHHVSCFFKRSYSRIERIELPMWFVLPPGGG